MPGVACALLYIFISHSDNINIDVAIKIEIEIKALIISTWCFFCLYTTKRLLTKNSRSTSGQGFAAHYQLARRSAIVGGFPKNRDVGVSVKKKEKKREKIFYLRFGIWRTPCSNYEDPLWPRTFFWRLVSSRSHLGIPMGVATHRVRTTNVFTCNAN